jgi:hypothetical protein
VASFTLPLTTLETASHGTGVLEHRLSQTRCAGWNLLACRSTSACLYAYDPCVHLDFVLFDRFSGPPSGSYLRPSAFVSVVSMVTTITQHTHVSASGRSVPVMHPPPE